MGEICVSDVEVIPDITHSKDWFAHKVFLYSLSVARYC